MMETNPISKEEINQEREDLHHQELQAIPAMKFPDTKRCNTPLNVAGK